MTELFDKAKMEEGVKLILQGLGLSGADYDDTPERMARALTQMCWGVHVNVDEYVYGKGIFETEQKDLRMPTTFENISARGVCPHHLMPVVYHATVRYSPRKQVMGLSRVHRLVQVLAARPVLQEQLAYDIAACLRDKLNCPVSVRLEGHHLCMIARGSRSEWNSPVITELELE